MNFQFQSLADFIAMSGHGPYVWACYAITVFVIAYLLLSPARQAAAFKKQLQRQYAQQAARENERARQ